MSSAKAPDSEILHHYGDEPDLLREIVRAHQVLMAGFSREVGMPASRFALMRLVAHAGADIGVMDLARQLEINAAAVTRQLKAMEDDHLVRRYPDPKDGRRSYVRMSAKGLRLLKKVHDRSHELERALSATISAEEMAVATKVLVELRAFIDSLR